MTIPSFASLCLFATSSPPVDTVRQSLATHSDRMFLCLVVSSVVTGIGVIFEAPGELHELSRWLKLRRLNKKVGWKVPITFVGLLLVIGGILAEGVFEFLSADAETAIRRHDEQVLSDTIIQAGTAKDSADIAVADAKEARGLADAAGQRADAATKQVSDVGEHAQRIDDSLAMAQHFSSSREIRNPAELKVAFSAFKGKAILFRSYINDGDGYFLCEELSWIASDAGVDVRDQCAQFRVERPHAGTTIAVFAPDWPTVLSLSKPLSVSTLYGSSGYAPNPSGIIVFVGRKPDAFVGETAQTRGAEKRVAAIKRRQQNK